MLAYLLNYYDRIFILLFEHLVLTLISLGIALLIALPVGVLLSRMKWLSVPILAILGILYSIPSLAMFAFLIPIIGLGVKPAIIALIAYSQLILVRNVMTGFQMIDPSIIEAGKGMGLSHSRLFWKIELPLALPVILGGIRIATISIIGIATIASWINAGGLGDILFEGLYQNHTPKVIWGTIAVSLLAIGSNQLLLTLEKRYTLKMKGEL